MSDITEILGIQELWRKTRGNPRICVAVLDGLVDKSHPCFQGAHLSRLPTLVDGEATSQGDMSKHGTHVSSIIFGQHGSPVEGIAPSCRGLIVPVFADRGQRLSQLDLSRAIEQAVSSGAHIINISGGQLTDFGEAEDFLQRVTQLCEKNNILIVAATGNDGCPCLHVPAAIPSVLAVGAMDNLGKPMEFSNWGKNYQTQGILAPGDNILGAKPGGGVVRLSGTSFATPIVSGVAALLLSLQLQQGEIPDPHKVRDAILNSALPCDPNQIKSNYHCLVGKINISGAIELLQGGTMSELRETIAPAGCGCDVVNNIEADVANTNEIEASANTSEISHSIPETALAASVISPSSSQNSLTSNVSKMSNKGSNFITASQPAETIGENLVYALGTLGYDFGTEARRDSFKQLMPWQQIPDSIPIPPNPYDARQMVDYLAQTPSEAKSLIWTLNLDLTPIYAIEPVGPFANNVYGLLQQLLSGEVQPGNSDEYIERVSIPGRLTGKTVKLFSGQVVPVIQPENERGIYGWKINSIINAALEQVPTEQRDSVVRTLQSFLSRIYYDFRNLGTTSQDRAINFAATNLIQTAQTASQAIESGFELDTITVEKSPFCRLDSDCWDIKLKFFDPENSRRARRVFRYTIDVSDIFPVTLGEVKQWSAPY
ncbi:MAG: PatA/PatG family cyanobactin maturation protease [Microcystis sp. M048S1]|uniref:S8 family peptidase n=1 Tax=unclassified Microcystis TaxID=2643300 RepID=UPI001194CE6C|nr:MULTISPECIES: PatA/PatG family cyanobactin maturation protease [unclassified Microcystis]MCA2721336.1 PatA/PatG family cyanobactin maturation protease [Microcystis sp. M176S2]MCA2728482.1 PatA/PatG family cyanobactin maturation protease [Microcystis sp. M162S2]MCA2745526.1 PatA/PatG family cyanobactin maturation protease [Microcystis sp. M155S2]MCA2767843.1 PatA/PatG family cyanobactin maturation protease [Microcystis sp. M152S2]MCA2773823.1 PatA/PatG family cyanobactin maturation protease 